MVKIHGYNKEKKEKGFADVYLMAFVFAIVCVFVFIGGLHLLLLTINFVIKNWVWVLVGIGALVVVFKFLTRKKHG